MTAPGLEEERAGISLDHYFALVLLHRGTRERWLRGMGVPADQVRKMGRARGDLLRERERKAGRTTDPGRERKG
jgi:hypothetical protein